MLNHKLLNWENVALLVNYWLIILKTDHNI